MWSGVHNGSLIDLFSGFIMQRDALGIVVSHLAGRALVVVRGEIDSNSAPTLRLVLDDLELETDVVVDMGDVTFINSKGLSVLVNQTVRMRESGGRMRVSNPSRAVAFAVETSGIGELLYNDAGVSLARQQIAT
jgi:anti-anti-sigma factor